MCNVLLRKSKCINNKLSDDEKEQEKHKEQSLCEREKGQGEKEKVDSWLTIEGPKISTC